MDSRLIIRLVSVIVIAKSLIVSAQNALSETTLPSYLREDFSETGRHLPPGVPKVVDGNGNTIFVPRRFTTHAYQNQALELLIQEANRVASDMKLPEDVPITKTNLAEYHISPFGFAYANRAIGFVSTARFLYYVTRGNKFSKLCVADYDRVCLSLQMKRRMPLSTMDTNGAYRLATQWLNAASMDVDGLNRDCTVHVALSPFWNGLVKLGDQPKGAIVPIYFVWWTTTPRIVPGASIAYVEFHAPSEKLLQMSVSDPRYILRKPVVFTNLPALFPGVATIHTNFPAEQIYMPADK